MWHFVSLGLFFLCVFVAPYLLVGESVQQFFSTISIFQGDQFLVPGEHAFEVEKPGKYVIWSEISTFFKGRRYILPEEVPSGMSVKVVEKKSGRDVPVREAMGSSEKMGETIRYSILTFEISHPGTYTVTVENLDMERVFMLRPSLIGQFTDFFVSTGKRLGVAGLSFFFGLIAPPLLSIYIEVRRSKNKEAREKQTQRFR